MKPPKYRKDDIVFNWDNEKLRVIRSYGQFGIIYYEVYNIAYKHSEHIEEYKLTLDDRGLPPSKNNKDNYVPDKKQCPKCGNDWSITGFGTKKWYDCKLCNKTAEELCKDSPPAFKHPMFKDWF